jgi:hypothetical protein
MRKFLYLILLPLFLCSSAPLGSDRPHVWLWAWHRAENLANIDKRKVGVAFLAQTLTVAGSKVLVEPRYQPLVVPDGTSMMAVTRIQIRRGETPLFSQEQLDKIVKLICLTMTPDVMAVQIDFDARQNERLFYRRLLASLRSSLPVPKRISMTALASWSTFDNWLVGAPVDEKVPMFFSMGGDKSRMIDFLKEGRTVLPSFQNSVGVSVDDMDTARSVLGAEAFKAADNVYFFTRKPWNGQAIDCAMELAGKR